MPLRTLKSLLCAVCLLACWSALAVPGFAASAAAPGSAPSGEKSPAPSGEKSPAPHSRVECSTLQSRILARAVAYCVLLPPSYQRDHTRRFPVAFYLHGLGDNEQSLVNIGAWGIYDQLLNSNRIGEFVIVGPDGFRSFYINSRDGELRYEDFFFGELLPAMEKKYRIATTAAKRGVLGISMGGYGALHYGFAHPEKFAAISADMPALFDEVPRDPAYPILQSALAEVFGTPPDIAFFQKNSPLQLAQSTPLAALRNMTIYFDCGAQDRFGLERGTMELDKLLAGRGIAHEAHVYPGDHDAQFIQQHFAASLEAQSRGLGASRPGEADRKIGRSQITGVKAKRK